MLPNMLIIMHTNDDVHLGSCICLFLEDEGASQHQLFYAHNGVYLFDHRDITNKCTHLLR